MQSHRKLPSRLETRLALAAQPLLALAHQITGLKTSMVRTHVDADELRRAEDARGGRTFWAVPVPPPDEARTVVCGANQADAELTGPQTEAMILIAQSLQRLFEAEREACLARESEQIAEKEAIEARNEARQHATDWLHMERLAHTDELTGLLNRRAFMARWEEESQRSAARDYPIALLVIDADKFKRVNDTFGHLHGDVVLRAISATLLEVAKPPDIVARLGGDEFALVTTHATTEELLDIAARIQGRFATLAAEIGVGTTLSIGLVSSNDCARSEMVANADAALYRSKAADGNEAEIFAARRSSFAAYAQLEPHLRRARR